MHREPRSCRVAWIAAPLVVALALCAPPASAGKLYKWVDDDGQVHYSQTPRPDGGKADQITAPASVQPSLPVRLKGEYEYCGRIRLPGPIYDERRVMKGILRVEDDWQEKLEREELSLRNLYARTAYDKRHRVRRHPERVQQEIARLKKEIAALRCAMQWADAKRRNLDDYRHDVADDLGRLRFNLAELERRARTDCGREPPIADSETRYRFWESCMRRYNSRLKRTRKEIAVLELQQKQFR